MTISEAIKLYDEKAKQYYTDSTNYAYNDIVRDEYKSRAKLHNQIANWLKELRELKQTIIIRQKPITDEMRAEIEQAFKQYNKYVLLRKEKCMLFVVTKNKKIVFDNYTDYEVTKDALIIYDNKQWIGYFKTNNIVEFYVRKDED